MKSRTRLLALYGHRYHRVNGDRGEFSWLCPTCGLPADTIEHYPPLSRVSDYESCSGSVYIVYPCCFPCNLLGGTELDDTFIDRFERVKDKLKIKWKRHLAPVEWDDEELDELGPVLRSKVEGDMAKHQEYSSRINTYTGIDAIINQVFEKYGE